MNLIEAAERRWLPDSVIRFGIRRLLRKRVRTACKRDIGLAQFADQLRRSPLAVHTEAANQQHYEEAPRFFQRVLGPQMKYSCCLFTAPDTSLAQAELAMLRQTCEHAELNDGQRILELGCGWGSLSIWMAEQYPGSEILAISNSNRQRKHIQSIADARGLTNLKVETANVVDFSPSERFDRIVSVEMFEHLRNYEVLLERISHWLCRDGKLFAHIFCHRDEPYLFDGQGKDNWMGQHFFTGGIMPSVDLFGQFNRHLHVVRQWHVDGIHYWRTCECWLANLDKSWDELIGLLEQDTPARQASLVLQRWRMFFMACAELFRFERGTRWFVTHYLFEPNHPIPTRPTTPPFASLSSPT